MTNRARIRVLLAEQPVPLTIKSIAKQLNAPLESIRTLIPSMIQCGEIEVVRRDGGAGKALLVRLPAKTEFTLGYEAFMNNGQIPDQASADWMSGWREAEAKCSRVEATVECDEASDRGLG